jgi:hypothetical protein
MSTRLDFDTFGDNSYTIAAKRLSAGYSIEDRGSIENRGAENKERISTLDSTRQATGTLYLYTRTYRLTERGEKLEKASVEVLAHYFRTITRPKTIERISRTHAQLQDLATTASLVLLSRKGKPLVKLETKPNAQEPKVATNNEIAMVNRHMSGKKFAEAVVQGGYTKVVINNEDQLKHFSEFGKRLGIEKMYLAPELKDPTLKDRVAKYSNPSSPKIEILSDKINVEASQDKTKTTALGTGSARYDKDLVWGDLQLPAYNFTNRIPLTVQETSVNKIADFPTAMHENRFQDDLFVKIARSIQTDVAALTEAGIALRPGLNNLFRAVQELGASSEKLEAPIEAPSYVQAITPSNIIPLEQPTRPTLLSDKAQAFLNRIEQRSRGQNLYTGEPRQAIAA